MQMDQNNTKHEISWYSHIEENAAKLNKICGKSGGVTLRGWQEAIDSNMAVDAHKSKAPEGNDKLQSIWFAFMNG